MTSLDPRLPLRALAVFEAAARHGGFTAAAEELRMTQAGVSQHVAQLEAELGIDLFVRRHRGVQLTPAGSTLFGTVERGLGLLAEGVAATRRLAGRTSIQILTDYGFAAWWMMPRLAELGALLPGVEIRLATTQREIDATDADFDLAIMFGHGEWPGVRSTPLFAEEVYPVCAPAYLAGRPAPMAAAEIAGLRLLHLRGSGTTRERWITWDHWFAAHGAQAGDSRHDLAFDNAQLVLQATLLGQGVSIGWVPLIDDHVANGSLVRLAAEPLRSRQGWHVVEHAERPAAANIATLKAWLLAASPNPRSPA